MKGDSIVDAVVDRLVSFLETGTPPPGLFTSDAFCDLTVPQWRLQAQGADDVVKLRTSSHPAPGTVARRRCDPTPTGFVLEFEERWDDESGRWYCREMLRAEVDENGAISNISVYCTGDWDQARQDRHAREVALLRR